MEIVVNYPAAGTQTVIIVRPEDSIQRVKDEVSDELQLDPECFDLRGDELLTDYGSSFIASTGASSGYQVDVERCYNPEIRQLESRTLRLTDLPKWATSVEEIVIAALTSDPLEGGSIMAAVDPTLRSNTNVMMAAVRAQPFLLKYGAPQIRDCDQIVIEAVTNFGYALKYASPRLQDDESAVRAALQRSRLPLQFASSRLRTKLANVPLTSSSQ
eukprot:TRINITY_DN12154_c0_g1_i1.p1 TRINITY_DN12154_c0_g1~~TRINITY_DN12154_c0_g1_i1.p1  ORF type:complete len:215 (+),score=37.34 TRINITY_DN12154_c0_g1_i1:185-829(+)